MLTNPVFSTLDTGSTAITGWTVTKGSIDWIGTYWASSDGQRSLDLNGNEAGAVSQTFDTTPGSTYRVSFDMAGNPDGDPQIKVLVARTGVAPLQFEFDITGADKVDMGWVQKSFNFIAPGPSATLEFASILSGPFGAALDNVRVEEIIPAGGDTRPPAGAVHANDNMLWPPNNKPVPVLINGYVVDELSAYGVNGGTGVEVAYLIINGERIDLSFDEKDGRFRLVKELVAKKGAIYCIELFATDANGNSGLVDSTYVRVPYDMSRKWLPAHEGQGKVPPGLAKLKKGKK